MRRRTVWVVVLWAVFLIVHVWLGFIAVVGPNLPIGDVELAYKSWMESAFASHRWPGLDLDWVYPPLALVPMLIPAVAGFGLYTATWLVLVLVVDVAAFAVLVGCGRDRGRVIAGWWWTAFLVLTGPIAVGRLDTISVAVAIIGVMFIRRHPIVATAILTVAAWIKVWPAALVGAFVIVLRTRWRVLAAAIGTSLVILGIGFVLGGREQMLSFVTSQSTRGLQIESPLAAPWMWLYAARVPGNYVYYDHEMLDFEVFGRGVDVVAALSTPLMCVLVAALIVLAVVAVRRRVEAVQVLPVLSIGFIAVLVLSNKVGSPQYTTWLAVPIIMWLLVAPQRSRTRMPVILALFIAALTQLVYPYFYDRLLGGVPLMVGILTLKHLAWIGLFAWTIVELVRLVRHGTGVAGEDAGVVARETAREAG